VVALILILGKFVIHAPKLKFGFFPRAEVAPQFTNRRTLKAADNKILKLIIPIKLIAINNVKIFANYFGRVLFSLFNY